MSSLQLDLVDVCGVPQPARPAFDGRTARPHRDMRGGAASATTAGIERAVAGAERIEKGWQTIAECTLTQFIAAHPGVEFISPEVRAWAARLGFKSPASNMAWGAVFLSAKRRGEIRSLGYRQYGDDTMHTQAVRVWVAA